MVGTSSYAMIPAPDHSVGHYHWNHLEPRTAAHPHVPEASFLATKSGVVKSVGLSLVGTLQHTTKVVRPGKTFV